MFRYSPAFPSSSLQNANNGVLLLMDPGTKSISPDGTHNPSQAALALYLLFLPSGTHLTKLLPG